MQLPWQAFAEPDPDRDYLVLASYLPLKRLRSTPRFFRYARAIRQQLAKADGLVGYTLKAQPLRREYFTLSMWEDERALSRFVEAKPHVDIMAGLRGHMGKTSFRQWSTKGSGAPPDWSAAHRRLETG